MKFKCNNKVIFLLFYIFIVSCSKPEPAGIYSQQIDVLSEPVQNVIEPEVIKTDEYNEFNWTLTAVKEYELSGIIRGIKTYRSGWKAHFCPLDICITWGDLNTSEVEKYIRYSQSGRWYYCRFKAGCPVDKIYIESHASNNHIIPDNENILKAIKSAKKGNKIILKGYLVNLLGKKGEAKYWWNSSLSRNDRSDGSCEVFYVTEVIHANKIYN